VAPDDDHETGKLGQVAEFVARFDPRLTRMCRQRLALRRRTAKLTIKEDQDAAMASRPTS
jgi:hypothetical protein